VRMLVPPIAQRREIDRQLASYFQGHRPSMFRRAISDFCRFYAVRRPRIEWYEYIDRGRTAGRTFEDGRTGRLTAELEIRDAKAMPAPAAAATAAA